MMNANYIGKKDSCTGDTTKFYYYTIDNGHGYIMGIMVLDNNTNNVSVDLFHWENKEDIQVLQHFANNEEKHSFLKVYENNKGRYFNYDKERIYLPKR